MRLLKSVEELLYELVTWILFYPLTLWRCVRHPLKMMAYAEAELGDTDVEQFDEALSPPILLMITLFIAHLVELRFGAQAKAVLPEFFADERNLLFFRAVSFSVFPLFLALQSVRMRGAKLTRKSLRPAFYSQCYVAAPAILSVDIALIIAQHGTESSIVLGLAIFVVGLLWYIASESRWFITKGMAPGRAIVMVIIAIAMGFVAIFAVALVTVFAVSPPGQLSLAAP